MDCLASVTDLKVFGCVIDFLQTTTQTYLEDPIWDKLQQAVHVPVNPEAIVPEWTFAGVPRLRHQPC